jgi:predicted RNA binding protein YcfA (HicA-like mRNA interferase family)
VTLTNGTIYVTVPAKEIHVGLLSVILKDCGVPQDEFLDRL